MEGIQVSFPKAPWPKGEVPGAGPGGSGDVLLAVNQSVQCGQAEQQAAQWFPADGPYGDGGNSWSGRASISVY